MMNIIGILLAVTVCTAIIVCLTYDIYKLIKNK